MDKFKLGQTVKITDVEIAKDWSISHLVGEIFTVKNCDGIFTVYKNFTIPPSACVFQNQQIELPLSYSDTY